MKPQAPSASFFCGLVILLSSWRQLPAAPLAWFPGPPLADARSSAAAVAAANIYILGGSGANASDVLLLGGLDPYRISPPRLAPGAFLLTNGFILLCGGKDNEGDIVRNAGSFDPFSGYLTDLAAMNTARFDFGCATDGAGGGYAVGGLGGQPLASVEHYDPTAGAWTPVASLPEPRYHFPALFDGAHSIYVLGGLTNTTKGAGTPTVLRYDIASNAWNNVANLPVATAGSAAGLGPDGRIYLLGGTAGGIATHLVQVYDPVSNSWSISTPLPAALSASCAVVDALGRLAVMGGEDAESNALAAVWFSQRLNIPDSPPQFTSTPGTNATYQILYQYVAAANGDPPPTFSLASGPSGMQIDPYSGLVTWTPQATQIGTNQVIIQATNFAGSSNQVFNLTTIGPPPTTPSNVTVSATLDNSVTLQWDPSTTPIAGPVIYQVYERHFIHSPKGSGGATWYVLVSDNNTQPMATVSGLSTGSSHTYVVQAEAAGARSSYSTMIGVITTAPQGPINLWVTALTSTSISLAWSAAPGPAQNPSFSPITSYVIESREGTVNIPKLTGITQTSGSITGLTVGSAYLWFVQGVDAEGNASSLSWPYLIATNPAPIAPRVAGVSTTSCGGFQINGAENGPTPQSLVVMATTNLSEPSSWVEIGLFLPGTNLFSFTDTNANHFPARYYRLGAP